MLIDTHAHLWFEDFENDLDAVIGRAIEAGVEKMIVPGTDIGSSKQAIELARKYPGVIYAAVGVHPEELLNHNFSTSKEILNRNFEETPPTSGVPTRPLAGSPVEESPLGLQDLLSRRDLVKAIGEIGTDASTQDLRNCMDEQKKLFKEQCEIALEHDLPIIIHMRESFEETWDVLTSLPKMPRGQYHCFSIDEEALEKVIGTGFYVSFCGNITWSKRVAKLAKLVPDDRLLLETDSPLMVPRDKKGLAAGANERNEPANVRILAEKIAGLRGQTLDKIAEMTTENANTLFRL